MWLLVNLFFIFLAPFLANSQSFGNTSLSLISAPHLAVECYRPSDCRVNEACVMPDFDNGMPLFWPICDHYGTCACLDGHVRIENGTCLPEVFLNLRDICVGRSNERYPIEGSFCNGTHVICNPTLYDEQFGTCYPKPLATVSTPGVVIGPGPNPVVPNLPSLPPVLIVGNGQQCDSIRTQCDSERGLSCINHVCRCTQKSNTYDDGLGYCRLRRYADECVDHDECNSGYFASTGFECRMGRCRCQPGYEPIDSLNFNETTKSTYMKRICVIEGSHTYVPTGGQCTMNPERYSDRPSLNICHKRAFCRPCHRQLAGKEPVFTGICREMACNDDSECHPPEFGGSSRHLRCTRQQDVFDPPCERGVCECNIDTGYFLDRFSRCTPRFQLWLGDRCMKHADSMADPFSHYKYNEVLPVGAACESKHTYDTVVKCDLPFMEDYDGNCTNNADWRSYQDECDRNDVRTMCDVSRGLQCRSGRCACPNLPNFLWDGNTCRSKDFGDQCVATTDCDNKLYYPRVTGSATCDDGYCACGRGFSSFDYTFLIYNRFDDTIQVSSRKYCLRTGQFNVVDKGSPCHLSPLRQADADTIRSVQVCQPGLVCSRCRAERYPDDDSMGTCRSFNPPAPPTPPPPPVVYINGQPPQSGPRPGPFVPQPGPQPGPTVPQPQGWLPWLPSGPWSPHAWTGGPPSGPNDLGPGWYSSGVPQPQPQPWSGWTGNLRPRPADSWQPWLPTEFRAVRAEPTLSPRSNNNHQRQSWGGNWEHSVRSWPGHPNWSQANPSQWGNPGNVNPQWAQQQWNQYGQQVGQWANQQGYPYRPCGGSIVKATITEMTALATLFLLMKM